MYKLKIYNRFGNLAHEEFFRTKKEAENRYKHIVFKYPCLPRPSLWVFNDRYKCYERLC